MSYFIKKNEIGICRGFLIDCSQNAFNKPGGIGAILSHKLFNITLSVAMNDENITSSFFRCLLFFCPWQEASVQISAAVKDLSVGLTKAISLKSTLSTLSKQMTEICC